MIFKIKRFSKYSETDEGNDPNVKLIEGTERLESGEIVPTYRWKITTNDKIDIVGPDYSPRYNKEINSPGIDKSRIGKLKKELKNGYIFDSPLGDPLDTKTHCISKKSKPKEKLKKDRYIICTKNLNLHDRYSYKVNYPYFDDEKGKYVFPIVVHSIKDHYTYGQGLYSEVIKIRRYKRVGN